MRGSSAHNRYVLAQILSKWGKAEFDLLRLQGVTVGIDRFTFKLCSGSIDGEGM